jgi:outer membrane immunogenic protein
MKCKSLLVVLLPAALAVGAMAQESRQDVSLSATAIVGIDVSGSGLTNVTSTTSLGGLASYRYMLTPRSALEVNYQYSQMAFHYPSFAATDGYIRVHSRYQEISGAYVYSRNYGRYNPFVEAGIGGFIFSPIQDGGTSIYDVSRNTNIGAFYGAGLAYQISPSFDIRAEYRGLLIKVPSFNAPNNSTRTGVYTNWSNPVIGIAYHF